MPLSLLSINVTERLPVSSSLPPGPEEALGLEFEPPEAFVEEAIDQRLELSA